jgi:hypothetical protein
MASRIRYSRIVSTFIDLIADAIENSKPSISEEKLNRLLGPSPVLTQVFSTSSGERSHIATPPGVSEEHYCLTCLSKHLGTAKILIREALQRAEKGEPREAVLEKVRGAYEELMGAEDDSQALSDERIRQINSQIRDLRHWFFDTGVIVEPDKNKIAEALGRISKLNDEVYKEYEARKQRLKEFIGKAKERLEQLEAKISAESTNP